MINYLKIMKPLYLACIFYFLYKITTLIHLFIQFYFALFLTYLILQQLHSFNLRAWPLSHMSILCRPYAFFLKRCVGEISLLAKLPVAFKAYVPEFIGLCFLTKVAPKIVLFCRLFFYSKFKFFLIKSLC
jgi:hypothetical protein